MANVIIYLVTTIAVGVQIYAAMTGTLWWSPSDTFVTIGLVGVIIMGLGTAWGAVKGSSSAWIVFIGALFCWTFYLPGLSNLLGGMQESILEGRFTFSSIGAYLPLLPPALLAVASITALMVGPMGKSES